MDIKVVDQKGEEVPVEQVANPNPSDTTPVKDGEIFIQQVGSIFDFTPQEAVKFRTKLNLLIDYAKTQTEDHSLEGIRWAIRSLQGKVGTPPLGQKWINYLTEYAFLKMEQMRLQQKTQEYEHND